MKDASELPNGYGWILPDMTCLPTNGGKDDIKKLANHISEVKKSIIRYIPNNDITSMLDVIYSSQYIRIGRYKDTILFEHGALKRPTLAEMVSITDRCRYKGSPMRMTRELYNPEDTNRSKFFIDEYK